MPSPTRVELVLALKRYPEALALRAAASPKSSGALVELDAWFRGDLRDLIASRRADKGAYLTRDELGKLVEWKLARGKWRPRLVQLALSNSSALVQSTTLSSSSSSLSPLDALKSLSTLSGIGPATASALLSVFHPSTEPFLSDEAWDSVGHGIPEGAKCEYTVKGWDRFKQAMEGRQGKEKWEGGMEELEKGLWSWTVLKRYGKWDQEAAPAEVVVDAETTIGKSSKKRKSGPAAVEGNSDTEGTGKTRSKRNKA